LKGSTIVNDFITILDEYVENRFKSSLTGD